MLFRQTGSRKCAVPGTLHSLTAHISLCGRFSSHRPIRFHYNGSPPNHNHSRVTWMKDKHELVCPVLTSSVQVAFLGRIQSTPEWICIRIMLRIMEDLHMLKKGVQRVFRKRVASAQVISRIARQRIAMGKLVMPAKLCLRSLYCLLRRKKHWEEPMILTDECVRDLHWRYKNAVLELPLCQQPTNFLQLFTNASD